MTTQHSNTPILQHSISPPSPHSSSRWALAALLGGAAGIAFAPILVRWSEAGPSATAFYRILFALPWLWSWQGMERSKGTRPPATKGEFGLLVVAGLCFAGDLAIWHWSLRLTSVANSTLLTNCAPFFVALGAWVLFRERITPVFLVGMALAAGGAALVIGARFEARHFAGDLLGLTTAVFYAGYQMAVKQLRRSLSTASIMAWSGLVSCPVLLLIAVCSSEPLLDSHLSGWLTLVTLALVSHLGGQTLIAYAFGHLPVAFASLGLLLQPVIAALLAWAALNESLTWPQAAGGFIVLAGLALARRGNEEEKRKIGGME